MTRLVRFVLVAGLGTVADVGTTTLTRSAGLPVFAAVASGWTASLSAGFLLNRSWVFSDPRVTTTGVAAKYGALSAVNAVVAIFGVGWVVSHGASYLQSRLAASTLLLVLNFVVCRAWVFRSVTGDTRTPGTENQVHEADRCLRREEVTRRAG